MESKFKINQYYTEDEAKIIAKGLNDGQKDDLTRIYVIDTQTIPTTLSEVLNYVASDPVGERYHIKSVFDNILKKGK